MATRRFSLNPEDNDHQVTEAAGAAVVTKNIELTVDTDTLIALNPSITGSQLRMQINQALDKFKAYIETSGKFNIPG